MFTMPRPSTSSSTCRASTDTTPACSPAACSGVCSSTSPIRRHPCRRRQRRQAERDDHTAPTTAMPRLGLSRCRSCWGSAWWLGAVEEFATGARLDAIHARQQHGAHRGDFPHLHIDGDREVGVLVLRVGRIGAGLFWIMGLNSGTGGVVHAFLFSKTLLPLLIACATDLTRARVINGAIGADPMGSTEMYLAFDARNPRIPLRSLQITQRTDRCAESYPVNSRVNISAHRRSIAVLATVSRSDLCRLQRGRRWRPKRATGSVYHFDGNYLYLRVIQFPDNYVGLPGTPVWADGRLGHTAYPFVRDGISLQRFSSKPQQRALSRRPPAPICRRARPCDTGAPRRAPRSCRRSRP